MQTEIVLYTILTLCVLGCAAAAILHFVATKFYVYEDPKIDDVERALPGANCGGCGFSGCRAFAVELVEQSDISELNCPVGGAEMMAQIAESLGKAVAERTEEVATLRCGGCRDKRPETSHYDGAKSCAVAASLYGGSTGCSYGCFGYGDCVASCKFDAMAMNAESGLPEIDAERCVSCGACAKSCPKALIEMRKKMPKARAVYVACASKAKGAAVMKACKAGCIGCGKCLKVCPFEAITISDNLAYIDSYKCKLCRKCVGECPTGAIKLVGMDPLPKAKAEKPEKVEAKKTVETSEKEETKRVKTDSEKEVKQ